jgi:hypothetical protein
MKRARRMMIGSGIPISQSKAPLPNPMIVSLIAMPCVINSHPECLVPGYVEISASEIALGRLPSERKNVLATIGP